VLTGETGAGKSIIIDALGLIGGARGSSEYVRYGRDRAEIEASFDLPVDHPVWEAVTKLGIQADGEEVLIIRRELTANGKSMCRINGQMVNLTMLREVGELLINIHGQHEHQSLLKVERHLDWLDAYGGEDLAMLKQLYREQFGCFMALQHELNQLKETSQQAYQLLDLYRFQIDELHNAALQVGEDELLADKKRKLANAEKLMNHVNHAYERLYAQGAMDAVSVAIAMLQDVMLYDSSRFQPMVEQLQTAFYQLEDAAFQLRDYRENIEFNPERLEQIENRLEQLNGLKRKYGATVEEMIAYGERIQTEANKIEHKDERIAALEQESEWSRKARSGWRSWPSGRGN
jgi:DNA repair protein RecN (Recombination protein N)